MMARTIFSRKAGSNLQERKKERKKEKNYITAGPV